MLVEIQTRMACSYALATTQSKTRELCFKNGFRPLTLALFVNVEGVAEGFCRLRFRPVASPFAPYRLWSGPE